jgi:hypothetical protein
MNFDSLQSVSQAIVLIGIVLTALGGFGSYYFGQVSETELKNNVDTLVKRSETLEKSLEPLKELAFQSHPNLEKDKALEKLREDFVQIQTKLEETTKLAQPNKLNYVSHSIEKVENGLKLSVQFKRTKEGPTDKMKFLVQLDTSNSNTLISFRPTRGFGMFVGGDQVKPYIGHLHMAPISPNDPTIEIVVTGNTNVQLSSNLSETITFDIAE